jgi:hypothetical protein
MGWLKNVGTWKAPKDDPELAKANKIYKQAGHGDNLTPEQIKEIERLMAERERKQR